MVMASASIDELVFQLVTDNSQAVAGIKEVIDLQSQSLSTNANYNSLLQGVMNTFGISADEAAAKLRAFAGVEEEVKTQTEGLAPAAEEASTAFDGLGTAINVAFGMVAFQALMQFKQLLTDSITQAQDYSQAIFELQTGVNAMNAGGANTSMAEMEQIVKNLIQEFPVFSETEMTQAVASATYLGSAIGMSKDQMNTLVTAASALTEVVGGDLNSNMTQILKAADDLTTSFSRNLYGSLGLVIDKTQVYNDAVELGVAGNAKTYDQLTNNAKELGTMVEVQKQSGQLIQDSNTYLDTQVGQIKEVNSELKNASLSLGQDLLPAWTEILRIVTAIVTLLAGVIDASKAAAAVRDAGGNILERIAAFDAVMNAANAKASGILYGTGTNAEGGANGVYGPPLPPGSSGAGTPSAATPPVTTAQLTSMEKEFKDNQDSFYADQEKDLVDHTNKLSDLQENYQFKAMQDAETYQADIAKEQTTYNNQYYTNEEDYQFKLQQLRETYLNNIQDALRNRDATQVLKDNEKYAQDKEAAQDNYDFTQTKLKQSEEEKIQALAVAYNLKKVQEQQQYDKDISDANTQYQRELDALQVGENAKLKEMADNWVIEYNLNAQGLATVYAQFYAYYGPNGYIDQLFQGATGQSGGALPQAGGVTPGTNQFSGTPVTSGNIIRSSGSTSASASSATVGGSIAVNVSLGSGLEASIVNKASSNVITALERAERSTAQ